MKSAGTQIISRLCSNSETLNPQILLCENSGLQQLRRVQTHRAEAARALGLHRAEVSAALARFTSVV